MKNIKPVFWHQGLFLQPQHFQMAEAFQQTQLEPLRQFAKPHFWGVVDIGLSLTALEHRLIEIERGQFLFPDGTLLSVPENAIVAKRSFEDAWVDPDKPFTVYLGLRNLSKLEENVTNLSNFANLQDVKTRYVTLTQAEQVNDFYLNDKPAPVKTLVGVLEILFENEILDAADYQLFPIARVVRTDAGVEYAADFYPPTLSIAAWPELMRITKEIRDELTGRAIQLERFELDMERANAYDATLMRYKLAAITLSRYVPRLFHMTEAGTVHPWEVYGVLREAIAEVSTFTDAVSVLGETKSGERLLPEYDHKDIGACFTAARTLLNSMLNEITIGPKLVVNMPFDGKLFSGTIPPDFFEDRFDYYLLISTQGGFEDYQQSLLTAGKFAAKESVEVLAERSLPGIGLIHVSTPPPELPRRPDAHYVRLDPGDEKWELIQRTGQASLLWSEAPEDAEIDLVIVRR